MIVRYQGWPGTGLRLEDPDNIHRVLDTGGTHGAKGGMELFVATEGESAKIELSPEDVAHLGAQCNAWLAWHLSGRSNRERKDV